MAESLSRGIKNYALQIPTLEVFAGVNLTELQWQSLVLGGTENYALKIPTFEGFAGINLTEVHWMALAPGAPLFNCLHAFLEILICNLHRRVACPPALGPVISASWDLIRRK